VDSAGRPSRCVPVSLTAGLVGCLLCGALVALAGCGAPVARVWQQPEPPKVRQRDPRVATAQQNALAHPTSVRYTNELAWAYLQAGEPLPAQAKFQESLSVDRRNVEALLGLGAVAQEAGDFATAIAWHERALELEQDSVPAHSSLGELYLRANDPLRAAQEFRRAADLAPDEIGPLLGLSEAYRLAGRLEEAAAACREAIRLAPTSAFPAVNYGAVLEAEGDMAGAEAQYRRAIKLDPRSGAGQNNLAYLYAKQRRQLDEALALAQQALAAYPDEPSFLDTLGLVLYARGQPEAAAQALERAKQGRQWSPTIRYHLGLAYHATGHDERAIAELRQSLALSPQGEHAGEAKALLRRLASDVLGPGT